MQPHGQTHTTSDLRDPSLRSLAHEGSRHVDDAFVREHQLFVRRCLLRFGIAGADVDDAAQDVFVVALRHTGPFDVQRSARPWLYTVALNVARNLRRKHQRVETPMAEPPEVHVPPPQERSLHAHEARSLVHRALDELPPAQRDVVLLHRLEGWPMEMVAETVGCPVATAHSRLRLGSARLDRAVRKHALRARCAALLAAFLVPSRPRLPRRPPRWRWCSWSWGPWWSRRGSRPPLMRSLLRGGPSGRRERGRLPPRPRGSRTRAPNCPRMPARTLSQLSRPAGRSPGRAERLPACLPLPPWSSPPRQSS
ncbi:MAG: sigma-70 family RNA polymerase sigma factor [Sandaracinaceae bacterium]|nr:sigma-70 family RNA polymerase sigma factor [Sandaracinaceae bacterium]